MDTSISAVTKSFDPASVLRFDEWAAKEAEGLVGAQRIMLHTSGKLLPIGKMNPWANPNTERLDTAVLSYMITTTAAADEIADKDRGPGSGLPADRSHAPYCGVRSRRKQGGRCGHSEVHPVSLGTC